MCEWNIESGQVSLHDRAVQRDGMLVLSEESRVGFVLDPADDGVQYRITIGDVPLSDITPSHDDAAGMVLGGRVFWRDLAYFESARASTQLVLESRSECDNDDDWKTLISVGIYVLPSKIGEDRYEAMSDDLNRVSHSLLSDLYGKSRRTVDLKFAPKGNTYHSREVELRAIERTLVRVEDLLRSIALRPASRIITTTVPEQFWGGQRLHPSSISTLLRQGVDLKTASRPLTVMARKKAESFDIPEHRITKAFLELILRRCVYCADAATAQARVIASEKHFRDVKLNDGPSIYETVDLPRIEKLNSAVAAARSYETIVLSMLQLPFLRGIPAKFDSLRSSTFQRNDEYRMLLTVMRRFLLEHAQWYEGDDYSSVTKLTWRIFEQWTFLRVVDAFRKAGVELREWTDALRQNLKSRFLIDFDRDLVFEGIIGHDLRLRFRYEPWILGHNSAVQSKKTLYRGRSGEMAWSPDIVIECLRPESGSWVAVYAIVLDCKYTARVTDQHWNGITKYLEIRSSYSEKQVAKQLWLVHPSDTECIQCEDPAVDFSSVGPSCDQNESLCFRLPVTPDSLTDCPGTDLKDDGFSCFAEGTLAFLRRSFSGVDSD